MSLREKVCVKTPTGDLQGELFIGADGLPELEVRYREDHIGLPLWEHFRPATFPAAWSLRQHPTIPEWRAMPLLAAWYQIEEIQAEIRDAQRETEAEERNGQHMPVV